MDQNPRSAFVPSAAAGPALSRPGGGTRAASLTSRVPASAASPVAAAAPVATATAVAAPVLRVAPAPAPTRLPAAAQPPRQPAGAKAGAVVVLFRADLRVDDHAPLARAAEEAATVVPVVCFDPRHFGKTAYGFEKTGRYRAAFLLESARALRETLRGLGTDLVLRMGRPEDVVPDLARQVGAKRVFMHEETTSEEKQVEKALESALAKSGAELKRFWGNALYDIDDLPFDMNSMPDVYTAFREAVETRSIVRPPIRAPEALAPLPPALDAGNVPTLADLNIDDTPETHLLSGVEVASSCSAGVRSVQGGEPEALRRVRAYIDETSRADAGRFSRKTRGSAHLGADFSCRISPWLALGCVSPRRIYQELSKVAVQPDLLTKSATYFELVWRDFFRFITCKYSERQVGARSAAGSESSSSAWSPSGKRTGALAL